MKPFYTLNLPDIVKEVQAIYSTVILRKARGGEPIMRTEGITGYDDPINGGVPELVSLRKKYPFLDRHILSFNLRPNFIVLPHIDGHPGHGRIGQRAVSLNIPISGCNDSAPTQFYSNLEEDFYLEKRFDVRVIKPGVELVKTCSYNLTTLPILVNPQVPHSIDNSKNLERRISVSWTLDLSFTWETAVEYFSQRNLLLP